MTELGDGWDQEQIFRETCTAGKWLHGFMSSEQTHYKNPQSQALRLQ